MLVNVKKINLHFNHFFLFVFDHLLDLIIRDEEISFHLPVDAYVAAVADPNFIRCHKVPVTALTGYLGLAIGVHLVSFTADYAHLS